MDAIKDVVDKLFCAWQKRLEDSGGVTPEDLLKKILTKSECKHIKFNYFKDGSLGLLVDSSAWLYKFNMRKLELSAKLKTELPGFKELRLKIGVF